MELVVRERGSLRQLSRAFGALQKVGSHVFVEGTPGRGVVLRTLNTPKSAFCCLHFPVPFFDSCAVAGDSVQFALPLRGVLAVFRTISSAESLAIHCAVPEDKGTQTNKLASKKQGRGATSKKGVRKRLRRGRAENDSGGDSIESESALSEEGEDGDGDDWEAGARGEEGAQGSDRPGGPDQCFFRVNYSGGYAKTFALNCSFECEIFEAVVDTAQYPSRVCAPVKQLGGYLSSVRTNEITFKLSPEVLHIRSHAGPWEARPATGGGESRLETDISIPGRNLVRYRVGAGAGGGDGVDDADAAVARATGAGGTKNSEGVEMTFTVRELRAFFGFLDGTSGGQADVDMFCAEEPGQPVVFRPTQTTFNGGEDPGAVKAELVLATLIPPLDDQGGGDPHQYDHGGGRAPGGDAHHGSAVIHSNADPSAGGDRSLHDHHRDSGDEASYVGGHR